MLSQNRFPVTDIYRLLWYQKRHLKKSFDTDQRKLFKKFFSIGIKALSCFIMRLTYLGLFSVIQALIPEAPKRRMEALFLFNAGRLVRSDLPSGRTSLVS